MLLGCFLYLVGLGFHFSSVLATHRRNEARIAQEIGLMKLEMEEMREKTRKGD